MYIIERTDKKGKKDYWHAEKEYFATTFDCGSFFEEEKEAIKKKNELKASPRFAADKFAVRAKV